MQAFLFLRIGGVYKDFPENTQLKNVIYTEMSPDYALTNWISSNYFCYVMLDPSASPKEVAENFDAHFDYSKQYGDMAKDIHAELVPLTDIYYMNEDSSGSLVKSGSAEKARLLMLIAFLVIIVAGINFTNFSTSLAPLRIKSINTQKVLGSSAGILRASLLFEAVGISLLAFLCSLFIVWGLGHMGWLYFVQADTTLTAYPGLVGGLAVLSVIIGLIAGIYPSLYMTSFPPALVLKGSFGLSSSGKKLRTALIGFQFIVSIVLIISAMFVRQQNRFMQKYSLGFDKDQVVVVELNRNIMHDHKDSYVGGLKEYPGIEDVAFSVYELSKEDDMIDLEYARHEDKDVFFKVFYASENFLSVMDIQVEEGRDFTREDLNKAQSDYIINPAAERDFHLHPGDRFNDRTVLGVSKDFRFNSCRIASSPFVFALNNDIPNPKLVSYIRFNSKTNLQEAVAHVRETLKEIDPTFPFEISFYNTILNNLYQKEQTLGKLISLFGIMAILISIVGVFGLVLFETQYRRKEIGIRKINGATTGQILLMFNKTYIQIVSVCFIISIPIAWMGTQQWLENFAYKTPLHLWVFIVAFLIILSVTIGTVTFRNWQAANENPVNSVKSE